MVIISGEEGTPLKDIIKQLGDKSYPFIECRCKWTEKSGDKHDEYWGCCSYDNQTQKLTSLDHDSYSLDDLYNEWEEWQDLEEKYFDGGQIVLTVWEHGNIEEN